MYIPTHICVNIKEESLERQWIPLRAKVRDKKEFSVFNLYHSPKGKSSGVVDDFYFLFVPF